jgi:membrane protein YdbS with pleckstrin-like domain
MRERTERVLLRMLRVPPAPSPPAGSAESTRIFRASPSYFRYNQLRWVLKQLGALVGVAFLIGGNWFFDVFSWIPWSVIPLPAGVIAILRSKLLFFVEAIGLGVLIVQAPITYAMVRLDYAMRWYIVTDRSLRIREGLTRVREMTMTLANVQNLTIEQGPIQRLLGISDLRVRSAGGGGAGEDSDASETAAASMHVGYMRGVDDAPQIRDSILARLRQLRDAGLGDPDDEIAIAGRSADAPAVAGGDVLGAARELLVEARALRTSLG